jgi:hypothetical protein
MAVHMGDDLAARCVQDERWMNGASEQRSASFRHVPVVNIQA